MFRFHAALAALFMCYVDSAELVATWRPRNSMIHWLAQGPPGTIFAAYDDNNAMSYNTTDGSLVKSYVGHSAPVWCVHYGSDGYLYTSAGMMGWDSTARRWDVTTGAQLRAYSGHTDTVFRVFLGADGFLYTVSADRKMRQWDTSLSTSRRTYTGHTDWVRFGAMYDGFIYTASLDRTIKKWDPNSSSALATFTGHTSGVQFLLLYNGFILSASRDRTIRKSALDGTSLQVYRAHTSWVNNLIIGPDGFGYSVSTDLTMRQWDFMNETLINNYTGVHTSTIEGLCLDDKGMLYTGGWDYRIIKWNLVDSVRVTTTTPTRPSTTPVFEAVTPRFVPNPAETTNSVSDSVTSSLVNTMLANSNTSSSGAGISSDLLFSGSVVFAALVGLSISAIAVVKIRRKFLDSREKKFSGVENSSHGTLLTSSSTNVLNYVTKTETTGPTSSDTKGEQTATWVPSAHELSVPAFLEVQFGIDYHQESEIGRGGNGILYRCTPLSKALVARAGANSSVVKVVDAGSSQRLVTAFVQELSLMHKFRDHPAFVRLYGYSLSPLSIVMKSYDFGDLDDFIAGKSPTNQLFAYTKFIVVDLFKRYCDGIAYMHSYGIIHGDIKPANVLLDIDESTNALVPIIIDFGISRVISVAAIQVHAFEISTLNGASVPYAAPDALFRFRQKKLEKDEAIWKGSDLYSLSMTLYEMLNRATPWKQ